MSLSYQQVLAYLLSAMQFANSKLTGPVKWIQNNLSLKTDTLPDTFNTPLNFSTILAFILFVVVTYANNLICNIVGILYPVLYGLYLFNETPLDSKRLVTLNKYWMLFGCLTLLDAFAGFILHWIPGFFYAKIAFIYGLVRNDFALTNMAFGLLEQLYALSNIRPMIEQCIMYVNTRLAASTATVVPVVETVEEKEKKDE